MNDLETVRVTFTCTRCGSLNQLTAAYLHEGTVIHCSRCATSAAPIALLRDKPAADHAPELAKA